MFVVIDVDSHGFTHFIDTDPLGYPKVSHPDGVSGMVGVDVMLKYHNLNPAARTTGGWDIVNQLSSEPAPLSRWQRLVAACNGSAATAQAKALGLK